MEVVRYRFNFLELRVVNYLINYLPLIRLSSSHTYVIWLHGFTIVFLQTPSHLVLKLIIHPTILAGDDLIGLPQNKAHK